MLSKTCLFLFVLFAFSFSSYAQDYKNNPGYRFSKEDMHDLLLDKSKSLKTKAVIALTAGPVLTGIGAYIASKNGPTINFTGGGYVTVRNSNGSVIGGSIGALGIITTLSSIPLFISSAKAKREAALILKNEPTGLLNKKISVPGLSLRVSL